MIKMQTKPGQFLEFVNRLLTSEKVSKDYKPFIFPVQKENKAPSTNISWKAEQARMTIPEARQRLAKNNGNIGIAGRPDDRLILLDIDDPAIEDELKDTLKIRSRSRSGTHAIYWAEPEDDILPCNIPTEKGELRSSDQYVVAPGSYVPVTEEELQQKVEEKEITETEMQEILEDPFRGYYTIDNQEDIAEISFEELPKVFREQYLASQRQKQNQEQEEYEPSEEISSSQASALYELTISDLTGRGFSGRDPHPIHNSETGKNWSIGQGLGHCWRHQVSLNALQFLCVEAGYLTCLEAGTPHHNSSGGPSQVKGDDQAIWVAWKYAKENNYIAEDDPVPLRAMHYIARKNNVYDADKGELLPPKAYNKTIDLVEDEL